MCLGFVRVSKVQKSVDQPLEQLPAKEKRAKKETTGGAPAFPFAAGNGNGISPWRKFRSDRFPRCSRFQAIVSIDLTAGQPFPAPLFVRQRTHGSVADPELSKLIEILERCS